MEAGSGSLTTPGIDTLGKTAAAFEETVIFSGLQTAHLPAQRSGEIMVCSREYKKDNEPVF